jgi:hypothetical protein
MQWLEQVALDPELSGLGYRLAMYLAARYVGKWGDAWPGQELMADELGVTVDGIRKAMRPLVDRGHLDIRPRGRGNSYRLKLDAPGAGGASGAWRQRGRSGVDESDWETSPSGDWQSVATASQTAVSENPDGGLPEPRQPSGRLQRRNPKKRLLSPSMPLKGADGSSCPGVSDIERADARFRAEGVDLDAVEVASRFLAKQVERGVEPSAAAFDLWCTFEIAEAKHREQGESGGRP